MDAPDTEMLTRNPIVGLLDAAPTISAEDIEAASDPQPFDDVDPGEGEVLDDGEFDPPAEDFDAETIARNAGLDQNDTDNGRRLLNLFGDQFLNVREVGLHAWCGTHWRLEGGDHVVDGMAQQTARLMKLEANFITAPPHALRLIERAELLAKKEASELTEAERKEMMAGEDAADALKKRKEARRKFAVSCGNRGRTVAMIAQALPHCTVSPAALDADHMRFNVANGTLVFEREAREEIDLDCPDPEATRYIKTVEARVRLEPHNPADKISKMGGCAYEPGARALRFEAFVERFQPDAAQRRYVQAAAGRALLGGASTQVLIFFYGDGANGKSVFMETIAQALADYVGRLKPESITGTMEQSGDKASPDFARLQGKRMVMIAELPRGAPLREGLVKTMTGSEPMPVRHLNKGFFDMVPEFIPFMSGNQMPDIGGLDKGIWRRLKFVKWPVTLAEAEQRPLPEVVAEFMQEAPGILNWLIEGALIFLREGLKDPPSVLELTQSHREDSDPVGAFVRDCVKPDPKGPGVQARDMFNGFKNYCDANAIKAWGEKTFSIAMKQKNFVREDKRIRMWRGVRLEGVPDPQPPSYGGHG